MDQLTATYEQDGALVIPIAGEFDVGNAPDLERYLTEVTEKSALVVFDFSTTGYLDSSVLAVLIRRKKALGATVGFVVPPESRVRLIFDVSGLSEIFDITGSVGDAVTKLNKMRLGTV